MKSLTWLLDCILAEAGMQCDTDTHRDKITISRRIECEGTSFLTITLPAFCKDFEKSLSMGQIDSTAFFGFKRTAGLPAFLQGFLSRIFDPRDGRLLAEPSLECIRSVRQICLMHKKILIPCSKQRERDSIEKFLQVEHDLADFSRNVDADYLVDFANVAGILWSNVGSCISQDIEMNALTPKHGPGATAEKIYGNKKFRIQRWHQRLEKHFPFDLFGVPNMDLQEWEDISGPVELVDPEHEQPVRVTLVPKTLKTPRIIAIEPVCNQFIQQALLEPLVKYIETLGSSAGHVNFRDQSINQQLALSASQDGKYATIDMSDASDRVHKDLVDLMLYKFPTFLEAVMACRSTRATLPDGRTVHLNKFASMGSGLCFPIESMVFFTSCVLTRLKIHNLPPTSRNVYKMSRDVYIYGDDIIIPTDEVSAIANGLESLLLKVNYDKSFGTGKFRESCGMDAYDGCDVTPCYVRRIHPSNRRDVPELVSFVSLANQLYKRGWWASARRVREYVEEILGPLPHVQDTSPGLGWNSFNQSYTFSKWDPDLHNFKVKTWKIRVPKVNDPLSGSAALLKCFLHKGNEPMSEGHLERSVRPGSATLQYRWVLPY